MKAIIMLSLIVMSHIAIAQKNIDVPLKVRQRFASEFTDPQKMKWSMEKDNYEISFTYHHQPMSRIYTKDAALVETETTIHEADLPDDARHYATKKGKVKEAAKIVKADGTVQYEAEVDGVDLIFDNTGKFLREQKD